MQLGCFPDQGHRRFRTDDICNFPQSRGNSVGGFVEKHGFVFSCDAFKKLPLPA